MSSAALHFLLSGLAAPAAAAGLPLLAGWRPWRRARPADGRWPDGSWAEALAPPLAYAAVYLATRGLPPWPPLEAADWLLGLGLMAGLLGALDQALAPPGWLRAGLALPALLAVPLLVLWPIALNEWSAPEAAGWVAGLGLAVVGLWQGLERLARRAPGPAVPLGLALAAGGGALSLALSGTATWGLLGGALGVALGLSFLLALLRPGSQAGRGASLPFAVLLGGLGIAGAFYASLSWVSLALLLLAPLAGWIVPLVRGARRAGPVWTLVRTTPVLLLVLAAVAWSWLESPPFG
ncbi:MAG TPA: hypothetical protein PK668_01970 [Myxococcota bacterium]|nr:hypothetical protein [Myxococcota bacterium]HRY94665.1 hypothetical protein [Myxococcota bacterium]